MIETPGGGRHRATGWRRVCDFFSVGTNDLTQYTLAVDRGNASLAARFTPHIPPCSGSCADVQAAAGAAGIPVSVCGEMASEPLAAMLLLGLGYRSLSVAPPALLAAEVAAPRRAAGGLPGGGGRGARGRIRPRWSPRCSGRCRPALDLRCSTRMGVAGARAAHP